MYLASHQLFVPVSSRLPHILKLPLQLLKSLVVIVGLFPEALQRFYIWYGGRQRLPVRWHCICRVLDGDVAHDEGARAF